MDERIKNLFSLSGKVALVTGASSGIGEQIAKTLAGAGAQVLLLGRNSQKLKGISESLEGQYSQQKMAWLSDDLVSRTDWEALKKMVNDAIGEVDIIFNAAGVNLRQKVDEITDSSWDETIDINLKVPFFLSRVFMADMIKKKWGKIINIGSLQSQRAFPNSISYGASKGGVWQLTRAMAEAWSGEGISCNAIAPGFFPTALTEKLFKDDEKRESLAKQTAIKRNGVLSDLDGLTIFLASSASDYITGQLIFIDGGWTAK